MNQIGIKNWKRFQHFKDRRPPWIKLYRDLLDDRDWHNLDPSAAKLLISLWLLASEADGMLPTVQDIAFRVRISEESCKSLIAKLQHWLDINAISTRYQHDTPETETEREAEAEAEAEAAPAATIDSPIMSAVVRFKSILPEFSRIPDMAIANAFRGVREPAWNPALTDFARDMVQSIKLPDNPLRLFRGYLAKAAEKTGALTREERQARLVARLGGASL